MCFSTNSLLVRVFVEDLCVYVCVCLYINVYVYVCGRVNVCTLVYV